jgi:hypothetical protein
MALSSAALKHWATGVCPSGTERYGGIVQGMTREPDYSSFLIAVAGSGTADSWATMRQVS